MFDRCSILRGAPNFRDIGGYAVANGQKIRCERVYRSGNLAKLSKSDLKRFAALNIHTILDLRNPHEVKQSPNRLPQNHTYKLHNIDFPHPHINYVELFQKTMTGKMRDFDFYQFLLDEYTRYVTQHDEQLKAIFSHLINPENYPILIHCTGGKDRTGIVIALLLHSLGVDKDAIFHDYLLSQTYMAAYLRKMMITVKLMSLFRVNLKQLKPLAETYPEYLQQAWDTIENQHGSLESYLANLGISPERKNHLQTLLCD